MDYPYTERDLSWLSFNFRVLQEAQDASVPLYERIKFLAIYSSNLDEFFRVRVATMRSFKQLRKKTRQKLQIKPKKILSQIQEEVSRQQALFGTIFRDEILPALREAGISLVEETALDARQTDWARQFFTEQIRPHLHAEQITPDSPAPFLKNKALYLVVVSESTADSYYVLEIPTEHLGRFVELPPQDDQHYVMFLDDLIRLNLAEWLGISIQGAFALKVSRDAELYIGDELAGNLVDKIKKGLDERAIGTPTRFLYDQTMPEALLTFLKDKLGLRREDLVPGARYHNFNDFLSFPDPSNNPDLHDPPWPALSHPTLERSDSFLARIENQDQLLHFPYQKYEYVSRLLWEAAEDPGVTEIKITLYRVAGQSAIARGLMAALANGKKVVAFVEVKARFDEASNLYWGEELKKAGATVLYSIPNIKVHTKLLLIRRAAHPDIAYLGTGNFNEKTARIYGDHALLTARNELTEDVNQVFYLLEGRIILPQCQQLLVAPFHLRNFFEQSIEREITAAKAGQPARIIAKMNSLEDRQIIQTLYRAAQAGVAIQLIVRGICCLQAGVEGWSENIEVISIVDRYLEHARIYWFENGGDEKLYLSSADWMTRNLDRRVEVAFPILDPDLRSDIQQILQFQLTDTVKARHLDPDRENQYRTLPGKPEMRAQEATYRWLANNQVT